jgi:glycogen operon protein
VVNRVKLIAEPWDLGEGGYQVGNFPPSWSEWNGRYRDTVRDFWRNEPATVGELAARLTGSSDLYQADSRRPVASINFVTVHDGFTLADLVSYNEKANVANGEENNDGESHNRSWNCGQEGLSDEAGVVDCRRRQQRNFLTTLLLSQGVPLVLGGDEIGRTQRGNNNAYCQDNEISWFDWQHADGELLAFTRRLTSLRRQHPVFRRRRWFQGRPIRGAPDIGWAKPDGTEMTNEDWVSGHTKVLGLFLNGDALPDRDDRGSRLVDDSFLLLLNSDDVEVKWALPQQWSAGQPWKAVLSSADKIPEDDPVDRILVPARSIVVLQRPRAEPAGA